MFSLKAYGIEVVGIMLLKLLREGLELLIIIKIMHYVFVEQQ
jgi:hypothetical protein